MFWVVEVDAVGEVYGVAAGGGGDYLVTVGVLVVVTSGKGRVRVQEVGPSAL